jgi:hypothetical protein
MVENGFDERSEYALDLSTLVVPVAAEKFRVRAEFPGPFVP